MDGTGPTTLDDLEEHLSRPTEQTIAALAACPGDVIVLGAGGKMGPSLTRMLARTRDALADGRRIFAVSRFADARARAQLHAAGCAVIAADMSDPAAVASLPIAPNVVYMVGRKFGTSDAPYETWYTNCGVPASIVHRYAGSRIVSFSSGNVYPLTSVASAGSAETDVPGPVGEYAASCLGRERLFEWASHRLGSPVATLRLNYAVDLRYGTLVDLATRVLSGEAIDVTTGFFNCIWQGDANAVAIASLAHASSPPFVLNVSGAEALSTRAVAREFGRLLGRDATFVGRESTSALLSDTRKMQELFGPPRVDAATLITWVAEWLLAGGTTLGKPTHFDIRTGAF